MDGGQRVPHKASRLGVPLPHLELRQRSAHKQLDALEVEHLVGIALWQRGGVPEFGHEVRWQPLLVIHVGAVLIAGQHTQPHMDVRRSGCGEWLD